MAISRRQFLSSAVVAKLAHAAGPALRLKIVVTGGHPGDPECGCAGTIARYAGLGHEVVLLYLNHGEGFCKTDHDPTPCGPVRTAEAEEACRILKVRPLFAGQVDGKAVVDDAHYREFGRLIDSEKPDIVFTQWPIDEHRDHRAISQLTLDWWLANGRKAALYYYEVADDTMMFSPGDYVDISAAEIESLRHAACYAHASQRPDKWYPHQVELTRFRGSQCGHAQAEAFLRHWQSRRRFLP